MLTETLIILFTVIFTLIAAVTDYMMAKVKNRLFIVSVTAGFLINIAGKGMAGLSQSLYGMFIPIVVLLPFSTNHKFFMGLQGIKLMGMGDVKLFAMVGALVGLKTLFGMLFWTYLFGGIYSLFLMLYKGILIKRLRYFFSWITGVIYSKDYVKYLSTEKMKFAPFVFAGVCMYYLLLAV